MAMDSPCLGQKGEFFGDTTPRTKGETRPVLRGRQEDRHVHNSCRRPDISTKGENRVGESSSIVLDGIGGSGIGVDKGLWALHLPNDLWIRGVSSVVDSVLSTTVSHSL